MEVIATQCMYMVNETCIKGIQRQIKKNVVSNPAQTKNTIQAPSLLQSASNGSHSIMT